MKFNIPSKSDLDRERRAARFGGQTKEVVAKKVAAKASEPVKPRPECPVPAGEKCPTCGHRQPMTNYQRVKAARERKQRHDAGA